MREEKIIYRQ